MLAISLCSGIGGLDIGFAAAGFDIIAQVEQDKFCQRVLKRHAGEWWPNAANFADVRDFGLASLPGIKPGDIAAMFGGFPCQPHSDAGKKLGAEDDRNLWPEFRRIISEFRPRAVLLENVPGILSGTGYAVTIVADLAQMGYDCRWGTIQAADTGSPHKRERWFCVAYDNGQRQLQQKRVVQRFRRRITHSNQAVSNRKALGNAQSARFPKWRQRQIKDNCPLRKTSGLATTPRSQRSGGIDGAIAIKSQLGRATDGLPTWLDEPKWPAGQGTYQHAWESPRTIGKGIDPHRSPRIKALGNSVMPQLAYALACAIRDLIVRTEDV